MIHIKLCGLTRICDITWANEVRPDYAGFVFAGTKRRISGDMARQLRYLLDETIPAVGVFADEPIEHIASLVRQEIIQMVQLHGHEDETYIQELRRDAAVPIIQAFSVKTQSDAEKANGSSADYVLLDNGSGGTGQTFDWDLLRFIGRPYFLAGGLHPGNVAAAVAALRPYAVDVSSGIETNGVKDREKIRQFVMQARLAASGRE